MEMTTDLMDVIKERMSPEELEERVKSLSTEGVKIPERLPAVSSDEQAAVGAFLLLLGFDWISTDQKDLIEIWENPKSLTRVYADYKKKKFTELEIQ